MRRFFQYLFISIALASFSACTSIDGDAEKAANLSKRSIEYTTKMEFDKAKKSYQESQAFFHKYEEKGMINEFSKAYNKYLLEE